MEDAFSRSWPSPLLPMLLRYMIMEYCGGGDLAGFYKEPSFGNTEFLRVGSELLSGVLYLHERNVAHRAFMWPTPRAS